MNIKNEACNLFTDFEIFKYKRSEIHPTIPSVVSRRATINPPSQRFSTFFFFLYHEWDTPSYFRPMWEGPLGDYRALIQGMLLLFTAIEPYEERRIWISLRHDIQVHTFNSAWSRQWYRHLLVVPIGIYLAACPNLDNFDCQCWLQKFKYGFSLLKLTVSFFFSLRTDCYMVKIFQTYNYFCCLNIYIQ